MYGIYVGRFCPIHKGHQAVAEQMIEDMGAEKSLIILGSIGAPASFRVLFNYQDRSRWVKAIYQAVGIVGVADFPDSDREWFECLMDIVRAVFPEARPTDFVFYGGSVSDCEYYSDRGYLTKIVDRGEIPISATVVRDKLLVGDNITSIIDPIIHDDVVTTFKRAVIDLDRWRQ